MDFDASHSLWGHLGMAFGSVNSSALLQSRCDVHMYRKQSKSSDTVEGPAFLLCIYDLVVRYQVLLYSISVPVTLQIPCSKSKQQLHHTKYLVDLQAQFLNASQHSRLPIS